MKKNTKVSVCVSLSRPQWRVTLYATKNTKFATVVRDILKPSKTNNLGSGSTNNWIIHLIKVEFWWILKWFAFLFQSIFREVESRHTLRHRFGCKAFCLGNSVKSQSLPAFPKIWLNDPIIKMLSYIVSRFEEILNVLERFKSWGNRPSLFVLSSGKKQIAEIVQKAMEIFEMSWISPREALRRQNLGIRTRAAPPKWHRLLHRRWWGWRLLTCQRKTKTTKDENKSCNKNYCDSTNNCIGYDLIVGKGGNRKMLYLLHRVRAELMPPYCDLNAFKFSRHQLSAAPQVTKLSFQSSFVKDLSTHDGRGAIWS